jgi:hypothetical protein
LPFADWGKVFDSTTVATAIADRLVYRSEILILGGSSYRLGENTAIRQPTAALRGSTLIRLTLNAPSRPQETGDVAELRPILAVADFIAARNGLLPCRPQHLLTLLDATSQKMPVFRVKTHPIRTQMQHLAGPFSRFRLHDYTFPRFIQSLYEQVDEEIWE